MIPNWLNKSLSEDGLPRIRQAIHNAEQHTSAEIVPMICHSSTPMQHVLPLLWAGALLFWGALFFSFEHPLRLPAWGWFVALALATITATLLQKFAAIQRACTNRETMNAAVDRRAELEFYRAGLNHTQDRTGVLIFASLVERHVVVLADKTIADRLPPETWRQAIDLFLAEIKAGNLERGYIRCIDFCAAKLQENFPIKADDKNELRNDLVILAD